MTMLDYTTSAPLRHERLLCRAGNEADMSFLCSVYAWTESYPFSPFEEKRSRPLHKKFLTHKHTV